MKLLEGNVAPEAVRRTAMSLIVSLGLVCVLFGCVADDDTPGGLFRHWVIDPRPNTGKDCCSDILALGDINGDGNLDAVIGSEKYEGASLVWYQFPTWEKHPISTGEFTTEGQLADVDGDGDLDVVVGSLAAGKSEILWFENVLGTGLGEWARHVIGQSYGHDVVVGDVNGDGKLDVVACDKKKVVLWEQRNPDSFNQRVLIERAGEGTALADIDGDGDLDVVHGGIWLENPGSPGSAKWASHTITERWSPDTRVAVADMNKDGRLDVVLTVSEGKGPLSWFEAPPKPRTDTWLEHPIEKGLLDGAHSLQVADIDNDGDLDIITAEMHTSSQKRVLAYLNEGGLFKPLVLARTGSHNMRVGDVDNDGDQDVFGKNYAGSGRVIEMWENQTSNAKKWSYFSIDSGRPRSEKGKMGLCFGDLDGDGFAEIIAGSCLYRNPKGNLGAPWQRARLDAGMDVFFAADVNGDKRVDLIGIVDDTLYWIEKGDASLASWKIRPVARVARGRTQGTAMAKLTPGERPQLIFSRGKNLFVIEIPSEPDKDSWPVHCISNENEEEGVAVGDIDRDGDLDIAVVYKDGHQVAWLENPGSLSKEWIVHVIGAQETNTGTWMDRIGIADLNGDGRPDIVATEERQDWKQEAVLYWYEAPADTKRGKWSRHAIARHRSLNSMDIADLNGDGAPDILVAEHTDQKDDGAQDNLALIYLNKNRGRTWLPQIVERGPHSSHLGSRLIDLDNDGKPEIVSIGWSQYRPVHLWKKMVPGYRE